MGYQLVPNTFIARNVICIDEYSVRNTVTKVEYDVRRSEGLIYIFRGQVEWRTFKPARRLLKNKNMFLFPVLQLLLPYIEMYQQLKEGEPSNNRSREFFTNGFNEIFYNSIAVSRPDFCDEIYRCLRCGIVHDNRTYRIFATFDGSNKTDAISIGENDKILINPRAFYRVLYEHFQNYCSVLQEASKGRHNRELYDNFSHIFLGWIGFVAPAGNQIR